MKAIVLALILTTCCGLGAPVMALTAAADEAGVVGPADLKTDDAKRPSVHGSPPAPFIPDDDEYAVFAAVLFPHKPELPDTVTDEARFLAEYRSRVNLGTLATHYNIRDETMRGSPLKSGDDPSRLDAAMIADFNSRNAATYRIDSEKLMRLLPSQRVRVHSDREFRDWDAYRPTPLWGANGITFLSRVGFNRNRTQAVVYIHQQRNPRMGVGYLVFLEKSATTGTWLLSGTMLTTIS